ncbi:MAG: hypothetical protein HFI30_02235 [Lachnospiraceae bacterium]|jgi:hypothetical protein|nr:hypothetical protein [Lachnospiraceae bacterium]MCI8994497.1 hypothetical protein [Lachnospiraceae bacterium]
MKKIAKGSYGYTANHKKRQAVKTLIFFSLPLALVAVGLLSTNEKINLLAVIGMVGSLPACKELVNLLIFLPRKSMDPSLYNTIHPHVESLVHVYELVLTTYEKNYPIDSMVISGSNLAAYSTRKDLDTKAAENHIRKILKDNGLRQNVKIFTDLKHYLERADALAAKTEKEEIPFTPDERYPQLTREELIMHLMLAISI